LTVSVGFATAIKEADYRIYACAILPDHVHLVIGWHPREIEVILGHLESKATMELRRRCEWDAAELWGEHGWNVPLDSEQDVQRAQQYVEGNPQKEGRPRQRWGFVTPFDLQVALADRRAMHEFRQNAPPRKIGGAALRSHQKRIEEMKRDES
jgi:hypothetical protein